MELSWTIREEDILLYTNFIDRYKRHSIVKERIDRNIRHIDVSITKHKFWRALINCLLTSQQRSGQNSRVAGFLKSRDPLFNVVSCASMRNLRRTVKSTLSRHGLRRHERISQEVYEAICWLNKGNWRFLKTQLERISSHSTSIKERSVARYLQQNFKGIGPKQSRNLIQIMGLSKYEIPLDSRIVKVLDELNFPLPLSSKALADENYYCFIEDGLQKLLSKINIYPCVFDACAFASYENDA